MAEERGDGGGVCGLVQMQPLLRRGRPSLEELVSQGSGLVRLVLLVDLLDSNVG